MTRSVGDRFGRIVCDDEIEDELIGVLETWLVDYQAEIERQRGWSARSLDEPAAIISVSQLEKQPEDQVPTFAVRVERVAEQSMPQSREVAMGWRVLVEVYAGGADAEDVRKRLGAHVAAARAVLLRHARGGEIVSDVTLMGTDYTPQLVDRDTGRTYAAGVVELRASVQNAVTRWRGGLREPAADPYAAPTGLVEVVDTDATVGTDL